jgi:hypothetical protein
MAKLMRDDRTECEIPDEFLENFAWLMGWAKASDGVWVPECDLQQYELGNRPFAEASKQ